MGYLRYGRFWTIDGYYFRRSDGGAPSGKGRVKGVGHVSVRVKQARLDNSVSTISSFRRRVRGSADGTGCFVGVGL